jgi:hypothetical protein
MSDDLKNVYKGAGALDRYFDGMTPVDLFRGQKIGAKGDFMLPTIIGWYAQQGKPRRPDILIKDQKGGTPQYKNLDAGELATEGRELELTEEVLRNADKYIVKGCRTMTGHHRGVSVFDKKNTRLRFDWYIIPAHSKLPDALAVTRDDIQTSKPDPIHYTLAPKDDMPLSLFLQYLRSIGAQAKLSKD